MRLHARRFRPETCRELCAQIDTLLAAPELVARTWAAAKREGENAITEREVTVPLADFATIWNELFAAELAAVRSNADRYTQVIAVYRAMGGGWVDLADRETAAGRAAPVVDRAAQQPLF